MPEMCNVVWILASRFMDNVRDFRPGPVIRDDRFELAECLPRQSSQDEAQIRRLVVDIYDSGEYGL
jgi:hypothetical protein